MLCPIAQTSLLSPRLPALISKEKIYTYEELNSLVQGLSLELAKKGVAASQRIAFFAPTTIHTILLFFALFRLQAIACPLNTYLPKEQLPHALEQLDAHLFLNTDSLSLERSSYSSNCLGITESQLGALLFTSGSSGPPKIACHSLGNYLHSANGSIKALDLNSEHRWLLSLPLYHVSGLAILFRCFLSGSAVVLSSAPLFQTLLEHRITHLSLVPTQLFRLLKEDPLLLEKTASMLRAILLGGAPLPHSLYARAHSMGFPIYPTYGLTEMSSQVTMELAPSLHSLALGSSLPHREIHISQESEILVRGKTLFQGYWKGRKPWLELNAEGWFATGDLGKWTQDNRLLFLGRKDHLFLSGGENIHPEEIEEALLSLEGIEEAIVVPIPDPEFGQRPVAFIHDPLSLHTLATLRASLRHRLLPYKIPIKIFPIQRNPESMKRKRRELQLLALKLIQ